MMPTTDATGRSGYIAADARLDARHGGVVARDEHAEVGLRHARGLAGAAHLAAEEVHR
jgi:hypothetical protein